MPKQPTRPPSQIKFLHRPTLRQEGAILAVMEAMEAIAPGVGYEWSSGMIDKANRSNSNTCKIMEVKGVI